MIPINQFLPASKKGLLSLRLELCTMSSQITPIKPLQFPEGGGGSPVKSQSNQFKFMYLLLHVLLKKTLKLSWTKSSEKIPYSLFS